MESQNKSQIERTLLFETVFTKEDLELFYKEVDQLLSLIFTGPGALEEKMDKIVSADKKNSLINYFKTVNANTSNLIEINQALSKIREIGDAIPIVTLELAFEPTEGVIKAIGYWFLKRLQTKVILDLHLERSIIGGAYIAFNGTYRDYTLQTKINKYFAKSSQLGSESFTENRTDVPVVNRE